LRSRALKPGRLRLAGNRWQPRAAMQPAAQPAYFQPAAQTPASAPVPQDPGLPRAGALETGVETTFVPFMRQADSRNAAVREMRLSAADRYSPETSFSWPPRLRRSRGSALYTISQAVSAETRICPQAAQEHPVMPPTARSCCHEFRSLAGGVPQPLPVRRGGAFVGLSPRGKLQST
jgi:hypothetical protein